MVTKNPAILAWRFSESQSFRKIEVISILSKIVDKLLIGAPWLYLLKAKAGRSGMLVEDEKLDLARQLLTHYIS